MNCYTVFKRAGTHADVLAAIGAADLLRHVEPQIVEFEDRFEVRLGRRLVPGDLDAAEPGFSYLESLRERAPNLPPERIVRTQATEGKRATASENRSYSILRRMKAFRGPNQVVARFAKMNREEWAGRVWESLNGRPDFVFRSPLVQLFNPQSAKGYALLKPVGTDRSDKTKDRWAEPFCEWLRFRGYFEGTAGWFTSGDLRLFCPIPADISYDRFAAAGSAFRELRLGGTAVKMDCRAVLGLTRILIESAGSCRRPREWIRGLWVTQYKDMGQAHAVMAAEQLAIPDWFEPASSPHAQSWLQTIKQHDAALRRLNDSYSDEFALLKQYRRTFQLRREDSIAEFVEFLAGYGMFLFKQRARDRWTLPQFTAATVSPILKADPDLRTMLRNAGFLAVAAAIRGSTVGAQAARANGKANHREIRYGLLAEIRRAGGLGGSELLKTVSDFVSEFNREGVKRRASGIAAAQIQDSEFRAFAALLERLPATVPAAGLLCAFSTCIPGLSAPAGTKLEFVQATSA